MRLARYSFAALLLLALLALGLKHALRTGAPGRRAARPPELHYCSACLDVTTRLRPQLLVPTLATCQTMAAVLKDLVGQLLQPWPGHRMHFPDWACTRPPPESPAVGGAANVTYRLCASDDSPTSLLLSWLLNLDNMFSSYLGDLPAMAGYRCDNSDPLSGFCGRGRGQRACDISFAINSSCTNNWTWTESWGRTCPPG